MPRKPRVTNEAIAAALVELRGNVGAVAKRYDVDRSTIGNAIAKSPALQQVCDDARETLLDIAESALFSAILDKKAWAIRFFLVTRGKKRGYIEKQQIELGEMGATDVVEEIIATREDATDGGPGPVPG